MAPRQFGKIDAASAQVVVEDAGRSGVKVAAEDDGSATCVLDLGLHGMQGLQGCLHLGQLNVAALCVVQYVGVANHKHRARGAVSRLQRCAQGHVVAVHEGMLGDVVLHMPNFQALVPANTSKQRAPRIRERLLRIPGLHATEACTLRFSRMLHSHHPVIAERQGTGETQSTRRRAER